MDRMGLKCLEMWLNDSIIHIRCYWDSPPPQKKNTLSIILLDIYIIRPACAKFRYKRLLCVPSVVQMYNVKPPSFKSTL